MLFGMCADLLNAPLVAAAGFDYIEGSMTAVGQAGEDEFAKMEAAVRLAGIRVEGMNLMLPGTFRLTGPNADFSPAIEFLKTAFARAGRLGTKAVSFGASGARNLPEGWPVEKGLEQLAEFLSMAAPIANDNGVAIGVEALNPGEANILTSQAESASLARRVNLPNVGILADWYHMSLSGEGVRNIPAAGSLIVHCHIANPNGRRFPLPGDGADYTEFFAALKAAGYDARMSVEAAGTVEEYAQALSRLKEYA